MKRPSLVGGLAVLVTGAFVPIGCAGLVVGEPPSAGESSSSGSSSGTRGSSGSSGAASSGSSGGDPGGGGSSGSAPLPDGGHPILPVFCSGPLPSICESCSDGENVCAHYVVVNGQCEVQVCPPGYPHVTVCAPGAACEGALGCVTETTGPMDLCSYRCTCNPSGVFDCNAFCPDAAAPPTGCAEGAVCSPGTGCGEAPSAAGCSTSCSCNGTGHLQCTTTCVDAGCLFNWDCIAGYHWDGTLCRCALNGCATAADCIAPLPVDGGCVQFDCVAGACQIAYCE